MHMLPQDRVRVRVTQTWGTVDSRIAISVPFPDKKIEMMCSGIELRLPRQEDG